MSQNVAVNISQQILPVTISAKGKTVNNYFDGLEVTGVHKFIFYIIMMA